MGPDRPPGAFCDWVRGIGGLYEFRLCLNTIVSCDFPNIEDPAPVPPTVPVAPTQDEITAKAELRALFSGIYPPSTREPTAWLRGRPAIPP